MQDKLRAINTIRLLSADAIEKANSGHPGLPLGAAPMAFELWDSHMKHNPKNPKWIDRDRFVLSAGHGSMLLYSLLYLFNYGLQMSDLENFRQLDSLTPGHPEYGHTVGVEATTGPLGQGIAMAVGMAMAEKHLSSIFNKDDIKIVDHHTFVLCGDGCLMEGISNEASSLAGTLGLNKLIVLYDSNNITIEGGTDLAFTENVRGRYEALGWRTFFVEDGNNIEEIAKAIEEAKKEQHKPSFIEIKTQIAYGTNKKAGSASAHGSPLGEEEIAYLRKNLNMSDAPFTISSDLKTYMQNKVNELQKYEDEWENIRKTYEEKYPEDYKKFERFMKNEVKDEYFEDIYDFDKDLASRAASGKVLNKLNLHIENLFGGSADLGPSNKSELEGEEFFSVDRAEGKNIHFGVREHAMAAIANGIYLHGGLRPYVATFFVFSDFLKPSLRLSALMKLGVPYILSHDSIGVGEDGPTHQPIEHLAMLRAMPDTIVFRPCDNIETAAAWECAIREKKRPTCLILSRQNLERIENSSKEALKGAYIVHKEVREEIDVIIIATGSEVKPALDAANELEKENISLRVVSMPSQELFLEQSEEYRDRILPKAVRNRVSVEALSSFGWERFVGLDGKIISIDSFGASAPAKKLYEKFCINKEHITEAVKELLRR